MVSSAGVKSDELVREDRVHYRVYTDPAVFEQEMEKIFSRAWVYVAHESEVAEPGDYKTTHLGRRPVIVARGADDGQVHVLYNRCRHRGATVCQFETGNASYFRCAYHGWTYNNRGNLIGVPYRQGYGQGFDPGQLGLVPVARVGSYRGLIFASLSEEGPSLEEHLGEARQYIDRWVAQSPTGEMALRGGVTKYSYQGNWKLQMENSVDGYHFEFVHQSFIDLFEERTKQQYPSIVENHGRDLGNGHAMSITIRRSMTGPGFVLSIFPNLQFLWSHIRVIRPLAVNRTEVALYHTVPKGAPEETIRKRLAEQVDFYGPIGNAGPDDWEMFERCQRGLESGGADWVLFMRGYKNAEADRQEGGPIRDNECTQRAIYRQWRQLMALD